MKKSTFLLLSIILVSIFFYGCAMYKTQARKNIENVRKIKIGMTELEVYDIMGKPYHKKVLIAHDGTPHVVLKYVTEYVPDGQILNSDLTPIWLENDRVIGWGNEFYKFKKNEEKFIFE